MFVFGQGGKGNELDLFSVFKAVSYACTYMAHHGLHLGEHAGGVHIVLASSTTSSSLVPRPITRPGPLVVLAVAVTVTLGRARVSGGQDGRILGGRSSVPN